MMTTLDLPAVLAAHKAWLNGQPGGGRANLSGANLRGCDLRDATLTGANLRDAVLSGCDLSGAELRGAKLRGAVLRDADLSGAILRDADLRGAILTGAILTGAVTTPTVVVQSGPLGSRNDYLVTLWHPDWPAEQVTAGCWTGTLDGLAGRVTATHGSGRHADQYHAAIAYHRAMVVAGGSE